MILEIKNILQKEFPNDKVSLKQRKSNRGVVFWTVFFNKKELKIKINNFPRIEQRLKSFGLNGCNLLCDIVVSEIKRELNTIQN